MDVVVIPESPSQAEIKAHQAILTTSSEIETKSFLKSEKSRKENFKHFKAPTYNADDTALGKLFEIKHALQKKGKITEEEYGVRPYLHLNEVLEHKGID